MHGKKLAGEIVLGLLLTTMGTGTAGATITNGTYNDYQGDINAASGKFVKATGNVEINVNGDVNYITAASEEALRTNADAISINLNMNNHNLTMGPGGRLTAMYNKDTAINILDAYDITAANLSVNDYNVIYGESATGTTKIQSNHDVKITTSTKNHPTVWVGYGCGLDLSAGNDMLLAATYKTATGAENNVMNINSGSTATLTAGHDLSLSNQGTTYPISYLNDGKLVVVAGHDFNMNSATGSNIYAQNKSDIKISAANDATFYAPDNSGIGLEADTNATVTAGKDITLTTGHNPYYVYNGCSLTLTAAENLKVTVTGSDTGGAYASGKNAKATLTATNGTLDITSLSDTTATVISDSAATTTIKAAKDITIGGGTRRALRAQGGTIDVTSETGEINLSATSTVGNINAGIYTNKKNDIRGTVTLHSNTNISAVTAGVQTDSGDVIFDKNVTVTEAEKGLLAKNTGTITVGGNANLTSLQTNILANNATVTVGGNADLTSSGNGIEADTSTVTVGGNANLTSSLDNILVKNATVTIGGNADLTSSGNGIEAYTGIVTVGGNISSTASQTNILANNATVTVNGDANLTEAETNVAADNSKVTVGGDANLTASDTNIAANTSTVSIGGTANLASSKTNVAADNATVTVNGDANLTASDTNIAANTSTVTISGDANLTASKINVAADNATVTLAKNVTLSGSDTAAIAATNAGKVTATDSASAKKITGAITSDGAGSTVAANFLNGDSYLIGTTTVSNGGAINLDFANGGVWSVTGTSSLTDLVNNSKVNMRYTGNNTSETITTANLSGNGYYIMNTDLESSYNTKNVQNSGDKLVITNSSSGNNILDLRDISLTTKLSSQGYLLLVEDQSNGSATFTGKDLVHGGIFKYKPVIVTIDPTDYTGFTSGAKNWYLTGFERMVEVSDNTNVTLGMAETRYGNYFMDNDTLLKRLGELRMLKSEPENDGVWAKYRHGVMNGKKFDGSFTTLQVGYDKKTSQKRYTGAAFSHTSNSFNLDVSTGEGSMDVLTVYNTWLGDKNHYFDIVGKVGKMRGDSSYWDSLYPETGDYGSWFYSIGGEYGRKNINNANGWYYEPQAQLTLGRINSSEYTTSLGTKVHLDAITSVLGRIGVTVGREYNRDNPAKHSNVYGKINLLHEFRGDVTTGLLDSYGDSYSPTAEYGGTWLNAGIGATVNFNKYTHLYLDLEKNFRGSVSSKWIGQIGCRWTWK